MLRFVQVAQGLRAMALSDSVEPRFSRRGALSVGVSSSAVITHLKCQLAKIQVFSQLRCKLVPMFPHAESVWRPQHLGNKVAIRISNCLQDLGNRIYHSEQYKAAIGNKPPGKVLSVLAGEYMSGLPRGWTSPRAGECKVADVERLFPQALQVNAPCRVLISFNCFECHCDGRAAATECAAYPSFQALEAWSWVCEGRALISNWSIDSVGPLIQLVH